MKKILIIGGSGLIGKKLKKNLKKKYKLIAPKRGKNFDIRKISTLKKYFNESIDVIINLSGQASDKKKMNETIIIGNKNIINLLRKLNKKILIIYFSTNLVYGYSNKILNEKSKTNPFDFYSKYKLKAEKNYERSNLNYLILRLGNIYGDIKKENNVLSKIYNSLKKKNKLNITNPKVFRNYISLDDLVNIIRKILAKRLNERLYNVGNENLNLYNIIKLFEKTYQKKVNFINQAIKIEKLSSQKIDTSKILLELNMRLKNKMYKYIENYKKNET